jgi:hypothetical protein
MNMKDFFQFVADQQHPHLKAWLQPCIDRFAIHNDMQRCHDEMCTCIQRFTDVLELAELGLVA